MDAKDRDAVLDDIAAEVKSLHEKLKRLAPAEFARLDAMTLEEIVAAAPAFTPREQAVLAVMRHIGELLCRAKAIMEARP